LPTIQDPNTGVLLWEVCCLFLPGWGVLSSANLEQSAAIILYLIEQYDKEHTLSYDDRIPEKYLCQQWLAFQATSKYPEDPIFSLPTPTG
jgi:hypothetical protein